VVYKRLLQDSPNNGFVAALSTTIFDNIEAATHVTTDLTGSFKAQCELFSFLAEDVLLPQMTGTANVSSSQDLRKSSIKIQEQNIELASFVQQPVDQWSEDIFSIAVISQSQQLLVLNAGLSSGPYICASIHLPRYQGR
jgi:hypothetical protein